ncbi:MAG: hypothetical protein JNL80_15050 [Phycisphaerae bacterium]|nr:hypothetical protein [Phycisphaerae bacterium]
MPKSTIQLFISAVTDEFRSYRDEAHRSLNWPGVRIEVQETFLALGRSTLVKLSEYIQACDAVVHLVGDRTGNEEDGGLPTSLMLKDLVETLPKLPEALGRDLTQLQQWSYTQWEAWLAVYHRKRLIIARAGPQARPDTPLTDATRHQRANQLRHLQSLAEHGRFPEFEFESAVQLCLRLSHLRELLSGGARSEIALSNVLSLEDYRAGLGGFRRFLSSDNLPFQAPPADHPCHPRELLRRMETSDDGRGILLVGAGGVGKTRTTYETAQLAEQDGWRVLYALPGQPVVTAERLIEAVLALDRGKTMVAIEYLDQMRDSLDIGALQRHLIRTCAQRNIRFGIIANARPGFLLVSDVEREACFETVRLEMQQNEADRLSRYVAAHSAPRAMEILGESELRRLCGRRPIIALLVAQQLELLAVAGTLQRNTLSAVRTGDLGHWLRRRLAEDQLLVPRGRSMWESVGVPPHLTAAAAILCCAPDDHARLVGAGAAALKTLNAPADAAHRIVGTLQAVGWLENDGSALAVVHDVVADEIVDQAAFELDRLRSPEFLAVLSPGLASARSMGRLGRNLTRIAGGLSGPKSDALSKAVRSWIDLRANELGAMFSTEETDAGSYALGAMVGGSITSEAAIRNWHSVVGPWLQAHKYRFEARHLLFRGLRSQNEAVIEELIPIGLEWLGEWRREFQASFVLAPLLQVAPATCSELEVWALEWLARYGDRLDAQFVITAFRSRDALTGERLAALSAAILRWLRMYGERPESYHALHTILSFPEVDATSAREAARIAIRWLSTRLDQQSAGPVLTSLLSRDDLGDALAREAATMPMRWLRQFHAELTSHGVLHAVLGRRDLSPSDATSVIQWTMAWIERNRGAAETEYLLTPLLKRSDVPPEVVAIAIDRALEWLKSPPAERQADYLFRRVLERDDLSPVDANAAIQRALRWLEVAAETKEAGWVLRGLLERPELTGASASQAVRLAIRWLELFPAAEGTSFIVRRLLMRKELKGRGSEAVVRLALDLMTGPTVADNFDFILKGILDRDDLQREQVVAAAQAALAYLERRGLDADGAHLLAPLLARVDLPTDTATAAREQAWAWLKANPTLAEAAHVLAPFLERSGLNRRQGQDLIALAAQWVEQHKQAPQLAFVLAPLLGRADLLGELRDRMVTTAFAWLEAPNERPDWVVRQLIERDDLSGDELTKVSRLCLRFIARARGDVHSAHMLAALLARPKLDGPANKVGIWLALDWLSRYSLDPLAIIVYTALLDRMDLPAPVLPKILERAWPWLEAHGSDTNAGLLLCGILDRMDLDAATLQRAVEWAHRWLVHHAKEPKASFVLVQLIERLVPSVPKDKQVTEVLDSALAWLRLHASATEAGYVLVAWCARHGSQGLPSELLALAHSWVEIHSSLGGGVPAKILRLCLASPLGPDQQRDQSFARVQQHALGWLAHHDRHPQFAFMLQALLDRSSGDARVVDLVSIAALNTAWRSPTWRLLRFLKHLQGALPPDDVRHSEIEMLLAPPKDVGWAPAEA